MGLAFVSPSMLHAHVCQTLLKISQRCYPICSQNLTMNNIFTKMQYNVFVVIVLVILTVPFYPSGLYRGQEKALCSASGRQEM